MSVRETGYCLCDFVMRNDYHFRLYSVLLSFIFRLGLTVPLKAEGAAEGCRSMSVETDRELECQGKKQFGEPV